MIDNNTPLTAKNNTKLLWFIILMLFPTLLAVGILPSFFAFFGIFMLNKKKDFSYIYAAKKGFILSAIAPAIVGSLIIILVLMDERHPQPILALLFCIVVAIITYGYILIFNKLFLLPLSEHKVFLEKHGVFSSSKKHEISNSNFPYDISKLKELAELKEKGHISSDEFDKLKLKLIGKIN